MSSTQATEHTHQTRPFGNPAFAEQLGIPAPPVQDPPMVNYRGNTLHQPFDLRARMKLCAGKEGKPMLGFYVGAFTDPAVARMVGQGGFDYVLLDWEHTPYSAKDLVENIKIIQYAGEGNTAVIVRVPSYDHHYIAWILDAGASGIIVPHVDTVEQAQQAVKNARFPPHGGLRSGPPCALALGYNDGDAKGGWIFDIFARAAVICQIESEVGASNADAIAAVDGVDGLMLGPGDLCLDLGMTFDKIGKDPKWIECALKVSQAANAHGKASLFPSFAGEISHILQMGYTMTTTGIDGMVFARAMRQSLKTGAECVSAWKEQRAGGGKQAEDANGENTKVGE